MSDHANTVVEVYKATLEFMGKLAVPAAILIVVVMFHQDISKTLEGLRLTKVETPLGSAQFEKIVEDLASAVPGSAEEKRVIRRIETQEDLVKAEIEGGLRQQIPVQGVAVPQGADSMIPKPDASWKTVMGVSWVKPNDLFGRTYFLDVYNQIYIWPIRLDANSKRAMFVINTSNQSSSSGKLIAKDIWVDVGSNYVFEYGGETYRLNLIEIKNAGSIPSNAAYISVDKKINT